MTPAEIFIKVWNLLDESEHGLNPATLLQDMFAAGMTAIDFETCIYSVEAVTGRAMSDKWCEGEITDHMKKSIEEFFAEFLSLHPSSDPMFVAHVFLKLRQSVVWSIDEDDHVNN